MELTLSLNHSCNLRCRYCYAGDKFNRRMPLDVAQKALDFAFSHIDPAVRVLFFGGEPLLEPDLVELVASETRDRSERTGKPARLAMTTNGTLLDDRRLDLIERYGIDLTVSLDGDRQAHDAARVFPDGKGSWQEVVDGLGRAARRFGRVNTASVIHPRNLERLPLSFDFIASLGVKRIVLAFDHAAEWDDAAIERLQEALALVADRVVEHYRAGNDFAIHPFHAKIAGRLKGGYAAGDRCDFGCAEIAVAPSGNLYPCDRLIGEDGSEQRDVVVGHVDSGVNTRRVQALRQAKDRVKADCRGCAFIDRCIWWCGCVNRSLTGRVDGVSGLLCTFEKLVIQAADRLAETLFAEQNEPFMRRYYLNPAVKTLARELD